jgi:casein kinase I family protein HRR25
MPYYGSGNLEEMRKKQKSSKLSKKSTMQIGVALVEAIERVHERKYIHRDIKPENFIVGSTGD